MQQISTDVVHNISASQNPCLNYQPLTKHKSYCLVCCNFNTFMAAQKNCSCSLRLHYFVLLCIKLYLHVHLFHYCFLHTTEAYIHCTVYIVQVHCYMFVLYMFGYLDSKLNVCSLEIYLGNMKKVSFKCSFLLQLTSNHIRPFMNGHALLFFTCILGYKGYTTFKLIKKI